MRLLEINIAITKPQHIYHAVKTGMCFSAHCLVILDFEANAKFSVKIFHYHSANINNTSLSYCLPGYTIILRASIIS